ncbi:MAG: hypothetical protein IT332_01285 [Ardenticatenales bacterium]|nr:hypothetical protein [Ardenticatenales bacterium]
MGARAGVAALAAAAVLAAVGMSTPSPHAPRARAAATLRPGPPTFFGAPPSCAVVADVIPSASSVRAGEIVTFTASFRAHCPQLLSSRAILIVVGGLPEPAVQPVRNSLGAFVDTVAKAGGSMAQLIFIDRNVQPAGWSATEGQFAALARDARLLVASPAPSAEDWTATMAAAERIVRTVPPTRGPMLVVVDGFGVAGGSADAEAVAVAAVAGAVRTTRDGAGRSVLFEVGTPQWLRPVIDALGPGFENQVLIVHTTTFAVERAMGSALAMFHAPLASWTGTMQEMQAGTFRPVAADPTADITEAGRITWHAPLAGHSIAVTTTGTFQALDIVGTTRMLFQPRFVRQGGEEELGPVIAALVCIRPAAPVAPDRCPERETPPSSVPPTPETRPGTATPLPPPTRPPDNEAWWRIWLPRADRQPPVESDR